MSHHFDGTDHWTFGIHCMAGEKDSAMCSHLLCLPCLWPRWGWTKVLVTFNHVGRSFNLFKYHHRGCVIIPSFFNLGLCIACWAHFMCHQELWTTSVIHPFSFLNRPLGLAWGKHNQKITLYHQTCSTKFCSSMLLSLYPFLLPSFLLTF